MGHEEDLQRVQTILQYTFRDQSLLIEALQAPGSNVSTVGGRPIPDGNRRLGLLGNTVIQTMLLDEWYPTFTACSFGSRILSKGADKDSLAEVARQTGIGTCINTNPSQYDEPISPAVLKTTVAALVGAVWIDSGRVTHLVQRVMLNMRLGQ